MLCLLISTLMLVPLAACRSQAPRDSAESPTYVSRADFKPGQIRPVHLSDRPESQARADEEAAEVIALVNGFYSTAFLDRKKWSGGTHPGLADFFTAEAKPHIGPNLGALALADLAPRLAGLTPTKQEAHRISFFLEDDLSVPLGVVSTIFEARAAPARGKTPVAVVHTATVWVVKEGDAFRIYSYTAELKADSQTRSAAFGEPPGGLLR